MATNNASDYGSTQYNVHVGGASGTLTNVAPSATSGIPLVSNGSSANPSFTTAVVAGGGTGLTSTTAYSVLCGGTTTTGALQSVASVGTTGQVLTSNGAGALPTFQAASGGTNNLVLIQSQTASTSSSISFTSGITSTYTTYLLVYSGIYTSDNSDSLGVQFSTNGGSSYLSSGYQGGFTYASYNGNTFINVNSTAQCYLGGPTGNTSSKFLSGSVYLYNLTTATPPSMMGQFICQGIAGNSVVGNAFGYNTTTSGVNALKIFTTTSSQTITAGKFTLFGVLE